MMNNKFEQIKLLGNAVVIVDLPEI